MNKSQIDLIPSQSTVSQSSAELSPEDWAKAMVHRINKKFRPVWAQRCAAEQMALGRYFLPHRSRLTSLAPTRPQLTKWYNPFADQELFPSGHRYCINVYTGCPHDCLYCYALAYQRKEASCKQGFSRLLSKDLNDLDFFNVPPAPVHISNSTDPFQPLEKQFGHTMMTLEGLAAHRNRFTSVTLLTKNPGLAARDQYIKIFRVLGELPVNHPYADKLAQSGTPPLQVEVSLAFWRDKARAFWDPHAPSVAQRIEGIRALRAAGIPVVLRIDPLFPRSPIPMPLPFNFRYFGLEEAQTLEDLNQLACFAKEIGAMHIVYSPVKIIVPRTRAMTLPMIKLLEVYRILARPDKLEWRGGSWRLPAPIAANYITEPFLEICRRHGVTAKFCKQNLLETF